MGFEFITDAARATKERAKDYYSFLKETGERQTLAAKQLAETHPKAVKGLKITAGVLGMLIYLTTAATVWGIDKLMKALAGNKEIGSMSKDYFKNTKRAESWLGHKRKKEKKENPDD